MESGRYQLQVSYSRGIKMGGKIFTCVNGRKYEVIFGHYVVKFIDVRTGKLKATTPVNAHPRELKNYL